MPLMNVAAPINTQCQERLDSSLSTSRPAIRTLAIAALLVYAVALVVPAINDGGLKDGAVVMAEPQRASGLGCLIGATIWGLVAATSWGIFGTTFEGVFDLHLLIFPVVSILFVVSTSLLRFDQRNQPLSFIMTDTVFARIQMRRQCLLQRTAEECFQHVLKCTASRFDTCFTRCINHLATILSSIQMPFFFKDVHHSSRKGNALSF